MTKSRLLCACVGVLALAGANAAYAATAGPTPQAAVHSSAYAKPALAPSYSSNTVIIGIMSRDFDVNQSIAAGDVGTGKDMAVLGPCSLAKLAPVSAEWPIKGDVPTTAPPAPS